MANIGWGKAGIYLCDLDVENSEWIQAPTPVENSTNLTRSGEPKTRKCRSSILTASWPTTTV